MCDDDDDFTVHVVEGGGWGGTKWKTNILLCCLCSSLLAQLNRGDCDATCTVLITQKDHQEKYTFFKHLFIHSSSCLFMFPSFILPLIPVRLTFSAAIYSFFSMKRWKERKGTKLFCYDILENFENSAINSTKFVVFIMISFFSSSTSSSVSERIPEITLALFFPQQYTFTLSVIQ